MKLTPLQQHYYAEKITLPSGVVVSGHIVTKDGRVYCTEGNIIVFSEDKKLFTFFLSQSNITPGADQQNWDAPYRNINSVPPGVSAENIIDEFIKFVENDIA